VKVLLVLRLLLRLRLLNEHGDAALVLLQWQGAAVWHGVAAVRVAAGIPTLLSRGMPAAAVVLLHHLTALRVAAL
jgi:hypothetical protein